MTGYRLGKLSLAVLALAVLLVGAGVLVKVSSGSAVLIVVGFVVGAAGVTFCWTALALLTRWAKAAARSDGGTTYDHLMEVKRRLDTDLRGLAHRPGSS